MSVSAIVVLVISGIFGTGGLVAFLRARAEGNKLRAEAEALGAKTPVEVESVSVTTMASALKSAQTEIERLTTRLEHEEEAGRAKDERIAALQKQTDGLHDSLNTVRDQLAAVSRELAALRGATPR